MNTIAESPELITFGEAARLSGQPKAYLRELAESGKLAVRLVPGNGESKFRLTRGALAEAGLFPQTPAVLTPERNDLADLIALVREQTVRITALEEQRFQLGAQLGVAVERVSSLEDQVMVLSGSGPGDDPVLSRAAFVERALDSPSARHAIVEIGQVGLRKSSQLKARLFAGKVRFPRRSWNGHDSGNRRSDS